MNIRNIVCLISLYCNINIVSQHFHDLDIFDLLALFYRIIFVNDLNEIRYLALNGANINIQQSFRRVIPLYLISDNCSLDIIRHLLDNGASPNIWDLSKVTSLYKVMFEYNDINNFDKSSLSKREREMSLNISKYSIKNGTNFTDKDIL